MQRNSNPWRRKAFQDVVAIDIRYKDKERKAPEVCVWRRTPAGKSLHIDSDIFPSYFYIPANKAKEVKELPTELVPNSFEDVGVLAMDGTKVIKLNWDKFSADAFKKVREMFSQTYEDDVKYRWRYMTDNDISFNKERRVCFFDIETRMSLDVEKTPEEILSIAVYDTKTNKYGILVIDKKITTPSSLSYRDDGSFVVRYHSERDLLKGFILYIQKHNPDILCAYNLYGFDWPYLVNRMRKIGVYNRDLSEIGSSVWCILHETDSSLNKCSCGGRELIDFFVLFKKLYTEDKPEDNKLNTIASLLLGKGKTKHQYKDIGELYEKDLDLFIEYNIQDALLLKELEDKLGFIKYLITLQSLIPMPLAEMKDNSVALDFFILKRYNGKMIFPSKRKRERKTYPGAITGKLVEDKDGEVTSTYPEKKMHSNVIVLDFGGMYPNIFRSFNISPETITAVGMPDSVTIGNVAFDQSTPGFFPTLVAELIRLREGYQSLLPNYDPNSIEYTIIYNLSTGVKVLNNSFYGGTAYSGFRLFDERIAESVTSIGRKLIKAVFKHLKSLGYEPIYFDTDSAFIPLKCIMADRATIEAESNMIQDSVNKMIEDMVLDMGANKNYMEMEFEKRFTKLVFMGVKKRYLGFADFWKGKWLGKNKMVIKGFDLVRRELSPACKNIIKTVIVMFLEGKTTDEVKAYYDNALIELKGTSISDLAWTKQLGKNISEYTKVTPSHIKACLTAKTNMNLDFRRGDSPKFMYVKDLPYHKKDGSLSKSDVIAFDKDTILPSNVVKQIDYDRFIDSFIIKKLRVFEGVVGMDMEKVLGVTKKAKKINTFKTKTAIEYVEEAM